MLRCYCEKLNFEYTYMFILSLISLSFSLSFFWGHLLFAALIAESLVAHFNVFFCCAQYICGINHLSV